MLASQRSLVKVETSLCGGPNLSIGQGPGAGQREQRGVVGEPQAGCAGPSLGHLRAESAHPPHPCCHALRPLQVAGTHPTLTFCHNRFALAPVSPSSGHLYRAGTELARGMVFERRSKLPLMNMPR